MFDPGSMWDGSGQVLRLILDLSAMDPGAIWFRSEIDLGWIQARLGIDLGAIDLGVDNTLQLVGNW